jgi:Tetratricopeptide repeat
MKKILIAFAFSLLSVTAFAEATFQQVETFIEQQQYEVASLALKEIIANHPNSAKAYYAMSQAQAGLGNLEKAQFALNKAKSIDPELKFATSSNIASLEQAITPQTKKIEVVTESHFWRNLFLGIVVGLILFGLYILFFRKKEDPAPDTKFKGIDYGDPKPSSPSSPKGPTTPSPSSYSPPPSPAPSYGYASAPAPTVVNNHYGSSNDGLLTGVLVGEMLANNSHHHDTVIVEQPVYVAPTYVAPAPSRSSSWDSSSSSSDSSWDSSSSSSSSDW